MDKKDWIIIILSFLLACSGTLLCHIIFNTNDIFGIFAFLFLGTLATTIPDYGR